MMNIRQKLAAYADPFSGSDRLYVEYSRMRENGEDGWEIVKTKFDERYAQIQAEYPWPVE